MYKPANRKERFGRWPFVLLAVLVAVSLVLGGCGSSSGTASGSASYSSAASSSSTSNRSAEDESSASGESGLEIAPEELIDELEERYNELEAQVADELEDRETAVPVHAAISQEVQVTDKLAVTVVSVVYEPHWLVSAENQYVYFDV